MRKGTNPEPKKATKMKTFFRSRNNKAIAGICGGLGEYLSIDPLIIRFLFILLAFITGVIPIVISYLLGWIIIPLKSEEDYY